MSNNEHSNPEAESELTPEKAFSYLADMRERLGRLKEAQPQHDFMLVITEKSYKRLAEALDVVEQVACPCGCGSHPSREEEFMPVYADGVELTCLMTMPIIVLEYAGVEIVRILDDRYDITPELVQSFIAEELAMRKQHEIRRAAKLN